LGVRSFCSSKLSTKFVKSVGRQYSSFGGSNGAKGVAAWSNTNTNSNRARTGAGFGLSLFLGSVLLTTTAVCDAKNDPKTKVYRRSEVKKHTFLSSGTPLLTTHFKDYVTSKISWLSEITSTVQYCSDKMERL
jgi:hypothetical protein